MYQQLASVGARKRTAIALIAVLAAAVFTIQLAGSASAATNHHRGHNRHGSHRGREAGGQGMATGLGQLSGLLPRDKLTTDPRFDRMRYGQVTYFCYRTPDPS